MEKRKIKNKINAFFLFLWELLTFIFLLFCYFFKSVVAFFINLLFPKNIATDILMKINKIYEEIGERIDFDKKESIKRIDLIDISVRNMKTKKSRTIITVGGMMVGVGAIVFLVSIGYGLQEMVVSRVAKLEEMKQIDASSQVGSKVEINDETIARFQDISGVESVIPIISVVGRVEYNNSETDVVTYGVISEYLKKLDAGIVKGDVFESNDMTIDAEKDFYKYNEIVVNQAMLRVLGLDENNAIGEKILLTFILLGEKKDNEVQSSKEEYVIRGVVAEGKSPLSYVPFINLRSMGIEKYSQLKVNIYDENNIQEIRKKIEAMGYVTRSVVDTVNQINDFFATARVALFLIGMIALIVAALGMFNTLTVSLLERTKEVGLMKAMGMKSREVKELFLTESMIMGVSGGVMGILFGFVLGKILSSILSIISFSKNSGIVNISHIPLSLIMIIVSVALVVGVVTGFYPARRASRITALNALKYE